MDNFTLKIYRNTDTLIKSLKFIDLFNDFKYIDLQKFYLSINGLIRFKKFNTILYRTFINERVFIQFLNLNINI